MARSRRPRGPRVTRHAPDGREVPLEDSTAGLTLRRDLTPEAPGKTPEEIEAWLRAWAKAAAPPGALEILDGLEAPARAVLERAGHPTTGPEVPHSPEWIAARVLEWTQACRSDIAGGAAATAAASMHRATWYAWLGLAKKGLEENVLVGRKIRQGGKKGSRVREEERDPAYLARKAEFVAQARPRIAAGEKKAQVVRKLRRPGDPKPERMRGWIKSL